jgi:asparagine synthase (glutamine-hydrolysing)
LCRSTSSPPRTFNVAFPDREFDETSVAIAVARHYKTDHKTIEVTNETLDPLALVDLLGHFDQPFADESAIPTYQVSRAIRDAGIICTLSGDGGDEAFGGYPPFWNLHVVTRLMRMPGVVHEVLSAAGQRLSPHTQNLGRQLMRAAGLAAAAQLGSTELLESFSSYLAAAQKHELVRADARATLHDVPPSAPRYTPATASGLDELSRRMTEYYFAQSLPSHMLRKVDMMSMRASIEVRVPMLDEGVADIGLSLVHALKTDGRRGKLVLRKLAERWLPPQVARHPKHGFAMPLDRMVSGDFHEFLVDTLLGPSSRLRGAFDLAVIERWIGMFRRAHQGVLPGTISREGLYQRVLGLLVLERWLARFQLTW